MAVGSRQSAVSQQSAARTATTTTAANYDGGASCALQDRRRRHNARISRRRSRLHFAGRAALPPAIEATTATDAEAEAEATDTESGLQRSSLRGCLVPIDTRPLAVGAAPVSPPPSPSLTYNNQDDEGGGERRRRRCQRRRLISGQAQRQQRRRRRPRPRRYCLMGLGGPHREHGVPAPMHTPACYTGGRMTSTATAKAQRRRRRQGALQQQQALSWHLLPLLPNGTVQSLHSHAKARACEGRLRLLRQWERRPRLRGGSGV